MFFRVYIDESSDSPPTIFTVGGFVGPENAWIDLDSKWAAAIPPRVPYFHTTDCFSGRGPFQGVDIPDRVALLDTLTDLIIATDIYLLAIGIDYKAYKRLAPKHKKNDFGSDVYAAPFGFVVKLACETFIDSRNENAGTPIPRQTNDACAFFIEDGDWAPSAKNEIGNAKIFPLDRHWRNRIGTETYGTSKDKSSSAFVQLLQVADFGAFFANKKQANAPNGKIAWRPYYERLAAAGKIFWPCEVLSEKSLDQFYKDIYQPISMSTKHP